MPVRLITLGGLRAERDGVELEGLPLQRLRAALFVYVAVERRAGRDVLTAVFWPESDDANARHALRQSLYHLRRTLGEPLIEAHAHELRVTDDVRTDVEAFDAALARGDPAAAARLYGGPFLHGVHLADLQPWESWVDARRVRYARAFRKACRDWVDQCRAAGDLTAAIDAAQRWTAPDPTDDEAQHRLIEALAAAGERAEAIRQYEAYVRLLEPDGLKPLDETVALIDSLRRTEPRTKASAAQENAELDAPAAVPRSRDELASRPPFSERTVPRSEPSATRLEAARSARRRTIAMVGVLLIAAIVLTLWQATRAPEATAPRARPRLAVLPFQNDTGAEELGWLAAGLTSGLTDALQRVSALEVTPTSGVRAYRQGVAPLPSVARELSADWLVGGSVERRGEGVVVRAELIDSAGRLVDSREVPGAPGEALRLTADVVDEVSSFLRVRIGGEVRVRGWSAGTRSDRAFRLLNAAVRDAASADALAQEGHLDAARTLFLHADSTLVLAADEDERWAEPHIQRALVARKLGVLAGRSGEPHDDVAAAFEAGIRHAEQAYRRQPENAAALEARGLLRHTLWLQARPSDAQSAARLLSQAESDLRAASTLDSSRARALSSLSTIQFAQNEYALARASAERAYAADAYLEEAREILARLFNIAFEAGEDSAAERWCAELRRRFPEFWFGTSCRLALMAWSADSQPAPERAWAETLQTIELAAPEYRAMIRAQLEMQVAGVLVRAGQVDSAARVLYRARARAHADTAFTRNPNNVIDLLPYEAEVNVLLRNNDTAATLLERYFVEMPDFRERFLASRRFRGVDFL